MSSKKTAAENSLNRAHHELIVDIDQLVLNVRHMKEIVRPARLCAVLKNDAYGHGLVQCALAIAEQGIQDLAIVDNTEAFKVRSSGYSLLESIRLWRIRPPLPWEFKEGLDRGWNVIEPVGSLSDLDQVLAAKQQIKVSVTLDCSMGREGFGVPSHMNDLVQAVEALGANRIAGFMTHLAIADGDDEALAETERELDNFDEAMATIKPHLPRSYSTHVGNSAAALRMPRVCQDYDMVRCGAILFGETTSPRVQKPEQIKHCLTWRTWVTQVREIPKGAYVGYGHSYLAQTNERVATLPVGYADGLKRTLGNGQGHVLIQGERCPIRGEISSSSTVVGINHLPEHSVKAGTEVVIIGQQGEQVQTPDDLAQAAGTGHLDIQSGLRASVLYVWPSVKGGALNEHKSQ